MAWSVFRGFVSAFSNKVNFQTKGRPQPVCGWVVLERAVCPGMAGGGGLSRRKMSIAAALAAVLCAAAVAAHAATLTVTANTDSKATTSYPGDGPGQTGDLRSAILNSSSGDTIQFNCESPCVITLNGPLPPITHNLTIDGGTLGNVIIDGNGLYRVFFVDTGEVQLENLQIQNARAKGGDGGGSGSWGCGGGGAGLGAGLFVNGVTANVTLTDVSFLDDSAIGGNGCTSTGSITGGGGGGGLGGNGGNGEFSTTLSGATNGGGGGVLGPGVDGDTSGPNGSAGGEGGGGGSSTNSGSAIPGPGGSGYGTNSGGGNGTGSISGGDGGFGGGGGGGTAIGGNGGFGGGGGGSAGTAGTGGPGGGGGGANGGSMPSLGGVLVGAVAGGNGTSTIGPDGGSGGGGAAAGPDIFVNQGTLTINSTGSSGASVAGGIGGAGAGNGSADATPVFNYSGTVNGSKATGPITGVVTVSPTPTFTVTSTADSGPGSLREALASAAFDGGANITFDNTVFKATNTAAQNTITLLSALTIPSNTAIEGLTSGSGASSANLVTVSGQNSTDLFLVESAGASIANLILTDGKSPVGAIFLDAGTLTISNSTLSGSVNSDQGGAIYQSGGALTISGSTFEGNTGNQGGAIYGGNGTLTISNSTFSGNSAPAGGAAVFLDSETLTVSNSTFSGNSGDYAIYNDSGTLTMSNSILAGNTGGDGTGTFGGGNNLIGDGSEISGITNGSNGNLVGTSASPINPLLTAIGNYGGPTQTMIPLPDSPAICAGSNSSLPSIDQRGFARTTTYGSTTCVDVGAVQTNYSLAFSTQPPSTVAASTAFSSAVTLSESGAPFAQSGISIEMALTGGGSLGTASTSSSGVASFSTLSVNTAGGPDTLTASLALSSGSISQVSSTFTVTAGTATYFSVSAPTSVTSYNTYPISVTALDAYGNVATGYTGTVHLTSTDPGFVNASGNIALTNGVGTFNVALKQAGMQTITATATANSSIYGTSSSILVNPGPVNHLMVSAPATANVGGQFQFTVGAYDLYGNVATNYAGTLHFTSSDASAVLPANSTLVNGTGAFNATLNKQGLQTITATDTLTSTITGTSNGITVAIPGIVVTSTADGGAGSLRAALATAATNGSAIITFDPTVFATPQTITASSTLNIPSNTTITGPSAGVTISGGGAASNFSVFAVASGVTNASINGLTIANGHTNAQGGGINNAGALTVSGSSFVNNYAAGYAGDPTGNGGGAIYADSGTLVVENSTFSGNSSAPGGAITANDGTVVISSSTFSGNSAFDGKVGGAIFINNAAVTIADSTFSGNSTPAGGGAIFNNKTLTVTNSIISGNSGGDCGANGSSTCPVNGTNGNVIGVSNINLASLGSYGGSTQTMIPLPGSPAICAGLQAVIPSGVTTDQRGEPNTNSTYPGYAGTPCVDAGAVQTNYALSFSTEPEPFSPATSILANTSFESAVTLTERGAAFTGASVSIPLALTSTPSGATLSNGAESTSTSTGIATYSALQVNETGTGDTLAANLTLNSGVTPAVIISASSAQFKVGQAAPTLSFTPSPNPQTYGAAITSSALNATASYSSSNVAGTFAYTTTVNGSPVTLVPGTTVLPVGNYTITATFTPSSTSAYTGASTTASYLVTAAAVTASVTASSTTYNGTTAATITGCTLSGVIPSDASNVTCSASGATFASSDAGSGIIVTATGITLSGSAASNYTLSSTTATTTANIATATLTVAANNAARVYGTANPAFTGSVSGALNGETFTESFSTTATISSPVGPYAIVPAVTGANIADYTQSVTNGTLTVTQAASTTTLATSSTSITPGQSVTLTATVKSATTGTPTGTVNFYDNGTLLNSTPIALSSGVATYATVALVPGVTNSITASYSGDANFTASSSTASTTTSVAPLDFTMALMGPSNRTLVPGQSISYQVQVTPLYGAYAGTVNFAVSGLPPGITAAFSPSSIAANSGPQTVTVTITAPAATAQLHPEPPATGRKLAPFALAFLLLFGAGSLRKRGRVLRGLLCVLVLLGAGAASSLLSGCSSNGGFFTQAQQSYSVTITATAGNVQHTSTITLNVQ